jgi:hypothetical protein
VRALLAAITVALALASAALVWWKTRGARRSRSLSVYALIAGAVVGVLCQQLERAVLAFTGLAFEVRTAGVGGALMAVFLLAGPLEEAAKVLVIWPLYRTRRIDGGRLGLCYAALTGAGFAAGEGTLLVFRAEALGITVARVVLSLFAHVFFAGAWGFALGAGRTRGRWFSVTWVAAVLLHALYDHIVWGRGPGYLPATAPMLGFMLLGAWLTLRDLGPHAVSAHHSRLEPPTLSEMGDALRPPERPVMLRWVGLGVFVTLGLVVSLAVVSVVIGRRMGIDFTLADEADVRSAGPLALLGIGILAAFPLAGYLLARASSAQSVLEPALSTLLALGALVVVLALTAPVAVLFALALTPIAIGLACSGAWLGLER